MEQMNNQMDWYKTFLLLAIISGVFMLAVCAFLVLNYFQQRTDDPLNSEELLKLRTQLYQQPNNESLKEQIRDIDLEIREKHFKHRQISKYGVYMLMGGIFVFLVGIKSVFALRKKLPMPQVSSEDSNGAERVGKLSRLSISTFATALAVTALFFIFFFSVNDQGANGDPKYPTQEEIARNWPQFRGPGGLGISAYTNVPTSWDGNTGSGILWKSPIPLHGKNSPIVWENRVFLTGATEEERSVYCYDTDSGELLWEKAVEDVPGSDPEPPEVMEDTGYAAPTAVTDGQRVYAIFANGDIVGIDFDGNQVWARNLGPFDSMYGYSSSLTMYQNLVIVLLDQGGADDGLSEIIGIDAATGRAVWSTPRPVRGSWASLIVIDTGERMEIITSADPWVIAYDPSTGTELWRAKCLGGDVAPTPVYADGLVYVTNVYEVLAAIRPGGEGDVTKTNIVWTAEDGLPDICSPLANNELVFLVETYGLITCYDAKTGEYLWDEDTAETFNASPSLVGEDVYLLTEEGVMIIIKAARKYEEIARFELGEGSYACPAFLDGRIYIRGEENLYCIANSQ